MINAKVLILGGGLTGVSTSYHIGHENCIILEKNSYLLGHIASKSKNGFTWDEGPHVSFTKNKYVQELFAKSVENNFFEFNAVVGNFYKGNWVDHPAQVNLYQFDEQTKRECLQSYLDEINKKDVFKPENYSEWLQQSFGKVFSEKFAKIYTYKYWTRKAEDLGVEWVGKRVYRPSTKDVIKGAKEALNESKHYIKKFRYPKNGGFEQFGLSMCKFANVEYNTEVSQIDLESKTVYTKCGRKYHYETLINTLPLPIFLNFCIQTQKLLKDEIYKLDCSSLVVFNIEVPYLKKRPEHWFYVYDEDFLSTRINFTESMSKNNAPKGMSGIQVEFYYNKKLTKKKNFNQYAKKILSEMTSMGLIEKKYKDECKVSINEVSWANVIFTRQTKDILEGIWSKLTFWGLKREMDDTSPMSIWENKNSKNLGPLIMAGRYGQWKYFWSDDCVLRGKYIAENITT